MLAAASNALMLEPMSAPRSVPGTCSQAVIVKCRPAHLPPAVPLSTPNRRDGPITVTLVIFCQSFQGLSFGAIALFLPLIREDMHISFAQGGLLSAAGTLTYALGQIPAGYLSDRFGPKRL